MGDNIIELNNCLIKATEYVIKVEEATAKIMALQVDNLINTNKSLTQVQKEEAGQYKDILDQKEEDEWKAFKDKWRNEFKELHDNSCFHCIGSGRFIESNSNPTAAGEYWNFSSKTFGPTGIAEYDDYHGTTGYYKKDEEFCAGCLGDNQTFRGSDRTGCEPVGGSLGSTNRIKPLGVTGCTIVPGKGKNLKTPMKNLKREWVTGFDRKIKLYKDRPDRDTKINIEFARSAKSIDGKN